MLNYINLHDINYCFNLALPLFTYTNLAHVNINISIFYFQMWHPFKIWSRTRCFNSNKYGFRFNLWIIISIFCHFFLSLNLLIKYERYYRYCKRCLHGPLMHGLQLRPRGRLLFVRDITITL